MSGKSNEKSSGSSGSSVSTREEEKASRDLPAPNSTEQPPLSVGLNPPEENPRHDNTSTIPSQSISHQVLPSEGEHHEQETSNSPEIRKVSRQERRRLTREKAKFKGEYLGNTSINVAIFRLLISSHKSGLF